MSRTVNLNLTLNGTVTCTDQTIVADLTVSNGSTLKTNTIATNDTSLITVNNDTLFNKSIILSNTGNNIPPMTSRHGAISTNYTSGAAEMDFWNNWTVIVPTLPAFNFYVLSDATTVSNVMTITNGGDLKVLGNLTDINNINTITMKDIDNNISLNAGTNEVILDASRTTARLDAGLAGYMWSIGSGLWQIMPIIYSMKIMYDGFNDKDYLWTINPGFKFVLYEDVDYLGGIVSTIDNTTGLTILTEAPTPNIGHTSSIKVYFNGIERTNTINSGGYTIS